MRWKSNKKGDTRVRSFYAWSSVYCEESNEWRWLEWVTVREAYNDQPITGHPWRIIEFLDGKPKDEPPVLTIDATKDWTQIK